MFILINCLAEFVNLLLTESNFSFSNTFANSTKTLTRVNVLRECKIPINFQLRNSVLYGFQTSKPELITELRFY